ncbi:MAG: glycosyltransferase family 39 protein [Anaerolineae bacterium]|nr:glycosyltransferase family 39 protein [Anaerolineae bacterium]
MALAVRLLTAWLIEQPGYADAYYYAVGARQLFTGHRFDEPFIWNYLDPPPGVPHPGYLYWMPLTAILGWLGMSIFGDSFRAIQAPFVLLSTLLPLLAYGVAWDLTRKRRHAMLAGLLAVFPGFYTHLLVLPDNMAPFALAGGLCLWAAGRGLRDRQPLWFGLAGVAAGLGHLARADGLLLALVALLAAIGLAWPFGTAQLKSKVRNPKPGMPCVALALAGYLAVMAPWFIRNWQVIGAPLSSAGTATLFLTSYDDMFAYGRPLTLGSYLAWGWDAILRSKAEALLLNLQRLWVENLLIFLLPLTVLGLWRLRRERLLWPFFLYAPLLFVAMTLAFTFPGMRGGLFHSGGALLPFLFAAAGPGLEAALRWAARRRLIPHSGANNLAWRVFSAGMVGLAILLSVWALWQAGALAGANRNGWNQREAGYGEIGRWLADHSGGDPRGLVVMAGDAPGLTWHTGYLAIAVPNEPLDTVLAVADRYGARYLILDDFRPRTTDPLYDGTAAHPRLAVRHVTKAGPGQTGGDGQVWQLYEIAPEQP